MNDLIKARKDPALFRSMLLVDTDEGLRPLSSVMDDWQRADFEAMDPAWRSVVTGKGTPAHSRAWLERARGHSKTSDEAVAVCWALFASRRALAGYGAASDRDQAGLLRNAINRLITSNPWLSTVLQVQNLRVINTRTDSFFEIISSDAPTSYGLLPDFVISDEVTHWKRRDLWDSLVSSVAKRKRCVMVCISNAGLIDDWQWTLRESIKTDPRWYFSRLEGSVASWIDQTTLDEQERLLPPTAFARLWLNEWATGGGDALSRADIQAAFKDDLRPLPYPVDGYQYLAGLDLGVSRDASAICVIGVRVTDEDDFDISDHGRIRLCHTRIWRPSKGKKVDLQQIENELLTLHRRYRFRSVFFDPYEARHMAQRLDLSSVPMVELTQTGQNLQKVASAMIEAFADRRVDLYDNADLKRDLLRLRVEERSYGFRLTSPRDATGHGDLASAFSFAVQGASELAGHAVKYLDDDDDELDLDLPAHRRIHNARNTWLRGIVPGTDIEFRNLGI